MNRTARRRFLAVPWSLFPRELSVGQVLSLSSLWRGHDCRTHGLWFVLPVPMGRGLTLLCHSFSALISGGLQQLSQRTKEEVER